MDKHLFLNEADTISRDIVKFALTLPDNKTGLRTQRELIYAATHLSSAFKIACYEDAKESIAKFNEVLENTGVSKFWLELLRDDGITPANRINGIIDRINQLISHTIELRKNEEKKIQSSANFSGEWLLDD